MEYDRDVDVAKLHTLQEDEANMQRKLYQENMTLLQKVKVKSTQCQYC